MPITIKNSAGGGVTLDSTTSNNETVNLPTGGGNLVTTTGATFTGALVINSPNQASGGSALKIRQGNATSFGIDMGLSQSTGHLNISRVNSNTATNMMTLARDTGFIGIGETSPVDKVHIKQNGDIGACLRIDNSNTSSAGSTSVIFERNGSIVGGIQLTGSATIYGTSSDYRLKENVTPILGATAQTKLLKPCNFDWIVGGNVNGFLAHELADVVPEAVTGTKDAMKDEEYEVTAATDTEAAVMSTRSVPDMQGIDQSKLVPLLTATIQELIARIEALENV